MSARSVESAGSIQKSPAGTWMPVACASIQEPSRAIGDYIAMMAESSLPVTLQNWFDARGWRVRGHQLAMLDAARAGASALLVAPTGSGKTLSGFLPSQIGRASCRESVCQYVLISVGGVSLKKKKQKKRN